MIDSDLKRVLILAYEFPPMGGIPSIRIAKYCKFLPECGWEPAVLTVRDAPTRLQDWSLMNYLPPGISVYSSFSLEPTRLVRWVKQIARTGRADSSDRDAGQSISSYTGLSFKVSSKIKALMLPDEKIGWLPFAARVGLKSIRETKPEVIFSTSPPNTTHLVALALKKLSGIPWVCEFRDPWTDMPHYKPTTVLNRRLFEHMERFVVLGADSIVCAMPELANILEARYGAAESGKFSVITNGFDAEDFASEVPLEGRFTITWIGSVYGDLYPGAMIEAARRLVKSGKIPSEDLSIRFVGTMDVESRRALDRAGLDFVEMVGFVEHEKCLEYMRSSHLLALKLAEGDMSSMLYTGKMFEYFGSRRPILAMVGEGSTAKLISDLGAGVVTGPEDITGISEALLHYYFMYQNGGVPALDNPDIRCLFESKNLTVKLAQVLEGVTEK